MKAPPSQIGSMVSIDPSTGETRAEFAAHDAGELSRRIDRARLAFERWGSLPITARSETLRSVARRMRERREALAAGITSEMGKPITQAEAEVEKCAWA